MFRGEVDALLYPARDEIDRDQDEQHRRDADDGEKTCLKRLLFHRGNSSAGAMGADDHARGEEAKNDHGEEVKDVARIEHAFLDASK